MEERKLTKEDIDRVRGIEGFPIAKDEDIIALSRPPYYTACPNPFVADFIREHGAPYDETADDYHCEPFAADVSEGKNDPIYMAHSYHTKVPYKAIMRYILHYTKPGDIIFDGFCGTGMTGVAAQMCGCPDADFKRQIEREMPGVEWGARKAILNDLSPAAAFIAHNYNAKAMASDFSTIASRILRECEEEYSWMFETFHVDANGKIQTDSDGNPIVGSINYIIWCDVFVCPSCSKEIAFWEAAVDEEEGKVLDIITCPHCHAALTKRDCTHALETKYDTQLRQTVTVSKQALVAIHYFVGKKRYSKVPDEYDLALTQKIDAYVIPYWCPTTPWPTGEKTREPDNLGIKYVHQMYSKRNLAVLAAFCEKARGTSALILMQSVAMVNSKLYRYRWAGGVAGAGGGPLSGTLFIPSIFKDISMLKSLGEYLKKTARARALQEAMRGVYCLSTQSTTDIDLIPDNSVEYSFTDPPFGNNLNYSELSFMWEAWLRVITTNTTEAIINKAQSKGLPEYQQLMTKCFCEYYRILKPGRWVTIEFHNSKNAVWNAIQEGLFRAGFIVADIRVINKQQGSFNQVTAQGAVKQDLVISAYKPREAFVREFSQRAGDPEMAWEFVRQHLQNVPIAPDSTGKIEVVAERQDYLLFDRMVAFHIMNGIPVPMGAHSFYAGLRERFIMRDGMFFLADQVNEYDERRAKMGLQDQQLSLLISDEKSAILWLGVQLTQERQSYSDLQPKYLQELHQAKFELLPELLDMLKENFLQDDDGKWYVPDLSDKADLEKLRRKRLLKDFYDIYAKGAGRIKNARTEAIRVGFDECWKERNYALIVQVGGRLPETVLQEDSALLMYYDNAASRM